MALPLRNQNRLMAVHEIGHGSRYQYFAATRGDDDAAKASPERGLQVQSQGGRKVAAQSERALRTV